MRTIVPLAVVAGLIVGAVLFLWPGPGSGPEPIAYGRDACAQCRMHMGQRGFAAEMRDREGKLSKYDDVGCLLRAMVAAHEEIPAAWVEDHDDGTWVPLLDAQLVRAANVGTPMGYGLVAFQDEGAADAFITANGGERVRLEEVLRHPGRLAEAERIP